MHQNLQTLRRLLYGPNYSLNKNPMPDINQVIDSLSDEELDLLNSDPQMLAEFKAKYMQEQPNAFMDTAKAAFEAATSSGQSSMQPIAPPSMDGSLLGALKGSIQAAGQTILDPTRLSATMSQPGQIAGQAVEDRTGSKLAGFATEVALDPQNLMAGAVAAKGAKAGLRGVANTLADFVPKNAMAMKQLFKNPSAVLPKILGGPKSINQAKELLDKAEAPIKKQFNKMSLADLDAEARILQSARRKIPSEVLETVDQIDVNARIASHPELGLTLKQAPVRADKLIQAEKALKQRISSLYDDGLGNEAKALESKMKPISQLIDQTLPQIKDARKAFQLASLREELPTFGKALLNANTINFLSLKQWLAPTATWAQAGLGAVSKYVAKPIGAVSGVTGNEALKRLTRKYLPAK